MATLLSGNQPKFQYTQEEENQKRLALLGVNLSKYPSVLSREEFDPILSRANRSIYRPIIRNVVAEALFQVPSPLMLTHIVTTRCNYSCNFCSFADTLNAKTSELSLEEIEKTYTPIG